MAVNPTTILSLMQNLLTHSSSSAYIHLRLRHFQTCAQIWCRIVRKYKVLFVADKAQEQLIRDLKVEYFETLDEAYARARELKGPDATLTCIPNGVSVVVKD